MTHGKSTKKGGEKVFYRILFLFIWNDLKKTPILRLIVVIGLLLIFVTPIALFIVRQNSLGYWCNNGNQVIEISGQIQHNLKNIDTLLSNILKENTSVQKKTLENELATIMKQNKLILKTSTITEEAKRYHTSVNVLETLISLPLVLISLLLGVRLGPAWNAADNAYTAYFKKNNHSV